MNVLQPRFFRLSVYQNHIPTSKNSYVPANTEHSSNLLKEESIKYNNLTEKHWFAAVALSRIEISHYR